MSADVDSLIAAFFDDTREDGFSHGPNAAWLLRDLRKLIAAGDHLDREGHGAPNISVSQCVLTGIEFVGRFYRHPLPEEVTGLDASAPLLCLSNTKARLFDDDKIGGRGSARTAEEFMGAFFPAAYGDPLGPGLSVPKAKALWTCFRHGHVHGYVQKQLLLRDGRNVTGQVSWGKGRPHLVLEPHDAEQWVFRVQVHALFNDLERAVHALRAKLSEPESTDRLRERFVVAFALWKRPHRMC
jgi:hypothetical protein